jgi:hypothetical protein
VESFEVSISDGGRCLIFWCAAGEAEILGAVSRDGERDYDGKDGGCWIEGAAVQFAVCRLWGGGTWDFREHGIRFHAAGLKLFELLGRFHT